MDEGLLKRLHKYCRNNCDLIRKSYKCYCFFCKSVFEVNDYFESNMRYIDEGQNALCPNCSMDTLLPDAIDIKITKDVIDDLVDYLFETNIHAYHQ